jgi:hypothetical protein
MNLIVSSNPVARSTEDAPARWLLDVLWLVLASGEGTNGEHSVIEQYMPVGSGPIPHIHQYDAERVENVHQDDLAARENPDGVNAGIDAFLVALPAAAGEEER